MSGTFSSLRDSTGIIGTCFVVEGHVFGTTLPGYSGNASVLKTAEAFRRARAQAAELGVHLAFSTVTYGDTRVMFADLDGPIIAIFHQDETDVGALAERLESHRSDLVEEAHTLLGGLAGREGGLLGVAPDRLPQRPPPPVDPVAEPVGEPAPPPIRRTERPEPGLGAVAKDLDRVLAQLTEVVGPAAVVILDDALVAWLEGGRAERMRLPALVDEILSRLPGHVLAERLKAAIR